MNILSKKLVFFYYFSLFISLGFKSDIGGISESQYWSSLEFLPFVEFLKEKSSLFFVLSIFLGIFFIVLRNNCFSIIRNNLFFVFLLLNFIFFVRIFFEDYDLAVKYFQSIFLYITMFIVSSIFIINIGYDNFKREFFNSIFCFSLFYIIINFITLISGKGFVIDNPRFFGVTSHPNFLGVNLVICNIVIYNYILLNNRKGIFTIIVLLIGFFLQVLTGSRTSFIILIVSFLGVIFILKNIKLKVLLISILTLLSGVILLMLDGEQFDRGGGGGNTRKEAWANMIQLIGDNPIIGVGSVVGNSENSYLRYAVLVGLPLAIILISWMIFFIYKLYFFSKRDGDIFRLFFSLVFALFAGGMLEGYLSDLWSFPKGIFVLIIILSFVSNKRQIHPERAI